MSNDKRERADGDRPEDSPTAWFVLLERARSIGNSDLARKAAQELRRLGVEVTYTHQPAGVSHDRA